MNRRSGDYFESEADGLRISLLSISPDGPCRGVIQLVHGMAEHKERYEPFMEYMAERGYAAMIHDHRGHGESVKSAGDLGYMYGGGAEAMLRDIYTVNRMAKERFPGIPLILMGHSMGSLAVRAFASCHDDCMDMLILSGSPSNNGARPLGTLIAKGEAAVFGPRHKSRILEIMSFAGCAAKFRDEKNKNAWICSDPEVYRAYTESELCGFTFTDDGYLALFELMREAYDVYRWKCTRPALPVLFISGAEDPCMGNVRKFARTVQMMRRAGYLDVKGKLYRGMRHEILNERGHEKVWRDLETYMKKKGF